MNTFRDTVLKIMDAIERETPEQTQARYSDTIPNISVADALELKRLFSWATESGITKTEQEKRFRTYRATIKALQSKR